MFNKILTFLVCFLCMGISAHAISYEELKSPGVPANRIGTDDKPEEIITKAKVNALDKSAKTKKSDISKNLGYADLSLKKIATDVAYEVEMDQDVVLRDLAALWAAAAQNSETVKYTIYKLSNPDEQKPSESMLKKIVRPIASFSTIAGTAFASNPFMAGGALIGGNLMSAFTSDNKEINYKFTKVNDADMVILVRKIDDLQKRLMVMYMDYTTKKQINIMAEQNLKKREAVCKNMQNKSREQVLVADVYYRNAQSFANKAKSEYIASKNILEQLVGAEVLEEIEKSHKNSSNEALKQALQ